jgi:hypothetical protein
MHELLRAAAKRERGSARGAVEGPAAIRLVLVRHVIL